MSRSACFTRSTEGSSINRFQQFPMKNFGVCAQLFRCSLACAIFSTAAFASVVAAAAPGKPLEARLLTPVSSYATKSGAPVEALITTPLCNASGDELPRGAVLAGHVSKVHRVGLGIVHETAGMR